MKILVVDDTFENRYLLEVLFKEHGHEVVMASNGVEGLEQLRSTPFDLIISDILMPRMDGYRFCRECKQDEQLRNIPLVLTTSAYVSDEDERFALGLGADRFIRWPIKPDTLMHALEELVTEHKEGRAKRPVTPQEEAHYLAEYSQRLVSQLEKKVRELESEIAIRVRADRALVTLSRCNQALVRALDPDQLRQEMCRLLVEVGNYRMAWISTAEQDESQTIRPIAHYGHDEGFLDLMKLSWGNTARGQGPTSKAIRTGIPQVIQDFARTPAAGDWRDEALKRGYASGIALPLKDGAIVSGTLTVYASEANAFSDDEVALLTELAGDLSYGITALRTKADNEHYVKRLQKGMTDTIAMLASTAEARDPYTAGHQQRTAELASAIARKLGLPEDEINGIYLAGVVHDIGKIQVPAEILNRPGRLSSIEFDLLKTHPAAGYEILKKVDFPWPIADMVLQHHERLDGSGYPRGLKSEDIVFGARILAVSDVLESMMSHRPYRPALGLDAALEEVTRGQGRLYDPEVVAASLKVLKEKGFSFTTRAPAGV
ncbi:MAG TPA: HD domain-containing phosphohydrolase [Rhodocyclaceae bacterium]|nr:HD domain-containing phosphohydrolase [Rhodocyclaceae bacterium]